MSFFSRLFKKKKPLQNVKGNQTGSSTIAGYSQASDTSRLPDILNPLDPISTVYVLQNEDTNSGESRHQTSEETPVFDSPTNDTPTHHDSSHDSTNYDYGSSSSSDSTSYDSGSDNSSDSTSTDSGSSNSDW